MSNQNVDTTEEPRRRRAGWVILPIALLASSAVVWKASYAAFSATTSNGVNNWKAGQVTLTDDDLGSAMFNANNLKPGSTGTKCIVVTSNSTLAGNVKLYGTGFGTTNGLASSLDLVIDEGTGGTFNNCLGFVPTVNDFTGTMAGFSATHTNFASGAGAFAVAGTPPESKTYRVTWTLNAAAPSSVQNGTANGTFTWEIQNT